jgi:hypothetical protein
MTNASVESRRRKTIIFTVVFAIIVVLVAAFYIFSGVKLVLVGAVRICHFNSHNLENFYWFLVSEGTLKNRFHHQP